MLLPLLFAFESEETKYKQDKMKNYSRRLSRIGWAKKMAASFAGSLKGALVNERERELNFRLE